MSSEEPDDRSPEDENGIKILSSGSAETDDDQDRSDSDGANTPESGVVVEGSGEESSEEYRRRVYGDGQECSGAIQPTENQGMRRLSRQFSQSLRRSSSIVEENLPKTPSGWAILSSVLASCLLGYEVRLQKSLTCPPIVYAQYTEGPMKELYRKLTQSEDSILRRSIQPSLFVGTRAYISSTAAYLLGGPSGTDEHIQFREIINLTLDGGKIAMEWELPVVQTTESKQERIQRVLKGLIDRPVVVVMHGINNHANFGYIRSMMRVCTDRGWIAAGMNLRGCGGMPLATPRGYNAAYTGDIRCVVQTLEARLAKGVPIFLVGNSLSASLVTKYLGEEGLSGTLPRCVAGGAALGLPASMNATNMSMIFSPLLSLGTKKTVLQNWGTIRHLNDEFTRKCIKRALTSVTLAQFDEALAPVMVRNDPIYPFAYRVGFKDGRAYWNDASSYRLVRFISVPTLQLIASDDFLVYHTFKAKLSYSVANPNVMVVESKCGGHLGWQESPPGHETNHSGASWADAATADFIAAVFETYDPDRKILDMDKHLVKERDRNMSANIFRSKL